MCETIKKITQFQSTLYFTQWATHKVQNIAVGHVNALVIATVVNIPKYFPKIFLCASSLEQLFSINSVFLLLCNFS